jgi:hypothetical protein
LKCLRRLRNHRNSTITVPRPRQQLLLGPVLLLVIVGETNNREDHKEPEERFRQTGLSNPESVWGCPTILRL